MTTVRRSKLAIAQGSGRGLAERADMASCSCDRTRQSGRCGNRFPCCAFAGPQMVMLSTLSGGRLAAGSQNSSQLRETHGQTTRTCITALARLWHPCTFRSMFSCRKVSIVALAKAVASFGVPGSPGGCARRYCRTAVRSAGCVSRHASSPADSLQGDVGIFRKHRRTISFVLAVEKFPCVDFLYPRHYRAPAYGHLADRARNRI